ncbi:Cupredoxin [Pterulicium gracile]|uniref:Cupredoxin n=1 Tax=Pterulicium gracile TaxID=1884261 RepID=A0A5C3QU18_9AGAR|nr:Cupredoxin [Pterula gracilis]
MYSTLVLGLSTVAGLVAAQNIVEVTVGGNAPDNLFVFDPPSIEAQVGDVVRFTFSGTPGNHTITQSTFAEPCNAMAGGFDSGWVFVPPDNEAPPATWNLTITSIERPIWFYCKQLAPSPHCSGGMAGAINAPDTGNTFETYLANARGFQGTPGQNIGGLVGNGASASAIPGPVEDGRYVGTPTATSPASASSGGPGTSNTAPPPGESVDSDGAASALGFSGMAAFACAVLALL